MKNLFSFLSLLLLYSCVASKNFHPQKKYAPQQLQDDYELFRDILEESHPSLYWYTPKDSVDYYFDWGAQQLHDSLNEYKFRNVLSYVLAKIHCGHTTARSSKAATDYAERTRTISFPLNVKAWEDTVVVVQNLNRKDSAITRGAIIKSIDGRPIQMIVDSLFQYISADGFNTTHKYQTISNPGAFRSLYAAVFGLRTRTPVEFIDTMGVKKTTTVNLYIPFIDTTRGKLPSPEKAPSKKMRRSMMLQYTRNMRVDTSLHTAFMELNSFSKNYHLKGFFKSSFKQMRKEHIPNLVIDLRGNGGGSVTLSNLLTKYIADKPFRIADSLYAVSNKSRYRHYITNYFLDRLFFIFMTRKRKDGYYHFRYFENRYFPPKKKNHFSGTTYVLTGGNTFSAAALVAQALRDQKDVVVVGEETGGGSYGNTAWLIPDVILPNTHVRFRLPLFRLVIDRNKPRGRGIMPEVQVGPTLDGIKRNADVKMETIVHLIQQREK
ncbi:MAG: S41 family peptidase [Flavisolibacter sp.]